MGLPSAALRWGPGQVAMSWPRVSTGRGQGRCNGKACVLPRSTLSPCLAVAMRAPLYVFLLHSLAGLSDLFLLPLKMALNDSMRVHLGKPAQYPINPLSHFDNVKMISAWLMTALVSLRELYRRPWESFHLRDLPFCGHPDLVCPTVRQPPRGPLWPSF